MSELTIGQLIKIVIGVFVVVAVVGGLALFFKNYAGSFFSGLNETGMKVFMGYLR
jgi:flagellar biosynthesis protein FliR